MNRIEHADPDAVLLIAFFLLVLIVGGVYLLAERVTRRRKWPQGHTHESYWGSARRVDDE